MVETIKRGVRKERIGVVTGRSGNKSIVVKSETRRPHPVYGKVVRYERKLHVHDEKNEANIGDKVLVMETRPLSKNKRWRLVSFVSKAAVAPETQNQG